MSGFQVVLAALALGASGPPEGAAPYDWALAQLRVPEAHQTTSGSPGVVVALIDLGYRHHPALDGHLWTNPRPARGDVHGWDFMDDDASLEYTGANEDSAYFRNHHVFVAGEIAAVAPKCPIMILRVGYQRNHGSWAKAVRYAADHGARVIVMPHGYIRRGPAGDVPLVYQGTDFSYPEDNLDLRRALDEAYDRGILVISGTADNLGRRVAVAPPAFASVCAVGSSNRRGRASSLAASADYVEFAAPAGEKTADPRDQVWGLGGDRNHASFQGGCMAAGFAGGVAALARSRFPDLSADQLRQVLRNTARPAEGETPDDRGWSDRLGFGLLDAARAVGLKDEQLGRDVRLVASSVKVVRRGEKVVVEAEVENLGVLDAERAMVVAYDGDPTRPADPKATFDRPVPRTTWQAGHAVAAVRGLHRRAVRLELTRRPAALWFETFCLDRHDAGKVHRVRVDLPPGGPG
ncbi:MAG: S8 family serine peptidase [Isosphaeraceae bacterium]